MLLIAWWLTTFALCALGMALQASPDTKHAMPAAFLAMALAESMGIQHLFTDLIFKVLK